MLGRLGGILLMAIALSAAAQDNAQQAPPGPVKFERDTQRMREQMLEIQRQQLQALKNNNPEEYQRRQEFQKRQDQINVVLSDFRAGKMTDDEAGEKLGPLVRKNVNLELTGLKNCIAQMENELARLKRIQKNPSLLVRRRIDELMGKRMPQPGELFPVPYQPGAKPRASSRIVQPPLTELRDGLAPRPGGRPGKKTKNQESKGPAFIVSPLSRAQEP